MTPNLSGHDENEILYAVNALTKRKNSCSSDDEEIVVKRDNVTVAFVEGESDQMKFIASGFDLNMSQLKEAAVANSSAALEALIHLVEEDEYNPYKGALELFVAMWMDGFLTAMMVSERRQRERHSD